jgi:cysteine desulfurase / selenocysteine lyase
MSTSDRDRRGPSAPGGEASADFASAWDAAFAAAASDPGLIGRIANELYAVMPGHAAPAAGAFPSVAAPPTPAPAGPPSHPQAAPVAAAVGPPTEAELRAIPASLAGAAGTSPVPPATPLTSSLQGASYYFLHPVKATPPLVPPFLPFQGLVPPEASPSQPSPPSPTPPVDPASLIFSPSIPPIAAVAPPSEAELRAAPATLGGATGAPPITTAAPTAQLPTASFPGTPLPFSPPEGEKAAPPRPAAPPALQGREFRPEVTPDATGPAPRSPAPAGAPTSAPGGPAPGATALPGSSYYFLDEGPTAFSQTSTSPRIQSLEFRPEVVPDLGFSARPFDPHVIRRDFPVLQEQVHGRPLIWLDNAATTQKPNAVIDRLSFFYRHEYSNIHRAAHTLAARATDAYEGAREKVRRFLHASSTREIVFVRGTTEGINLVAQSFGRRFVEKDDEIVITWLEHHANIVPWQMLCAEKGARLRVAPIDDSGQVILEEYEKLLGPRTRLVALSQVSNALGTITPAREMVEMAHRHGARVLVDGAQAVSHFRVDVQTLDCDFYVFSGHKVFAPSGIGVVYGKQYLLDTMPPWQGGGNMIACVTFEKTTYQAAPARFEAGTPSIADAVGLGAAIDYFESIGIEAAAAYEHELLAYATAGLLTVPGLRLIGTAREKASVLSFVLDGFRNEDVGVALDAEGIAVRAGHHCAQPVLRRFGVESTVRPSLAVYNTCEDVDALVNALRRIQSGRGHRGL